MNSTRSKQSTEHGGDAVEGRRYSSNGRERQTTHKLFWQIRLCYIFLFGLYMLEEYELDPNGKLFRAMLEEGNVG